MRAYQREWIRRRREEFFADKVCAQCPSTENLELDHIDRSTKVYEPAQLWGMSDDNPNKIAELKKCQVLCHECHKRKTIEESKSIVGEAASRSVLTDDQVSEIWRLCGEGARQTDVAKMFGVDKSTVNDIVRGRTWTHITKAHN